MTTKSTKRSPKKVLKRTTINRSIKSEIKQEISEDSVEDNVVDYELVSNNDKSNGNNSCSSVNINGLNIDTNTIIIPHNLFGNCLLILFLKFRQ